MKLPIQLRVFLPPLLLPVFALAANAPIAEPAGISNELRVSADEQLDFVLKAHGAQVYVCKMRDDDRKSYRWTFIAPQARLLEGGETVAYHGAGPVWESARDGSSVKGAVRAKQDAGTGNLPWLLLQATVTEGTGKFSRVSSIQRVATHGGTEPGATCDAQRSGQEAHVKYTADYYFYRRRPSITYLTPWAKPGNGLC